MTVHKTQTIELYCSENNDSIFIGEDGDGLGMVNIRSSTSTKAWGLFNFSLEIEAARKLAEAILETVNHIESKK